MADEEREYAYRPKWSLIVLCAVFFGLCSVVIGSKAANNDRSVNISRIIELDPDGATAFYWALTACSGGFVAVAAFLTYHRLAYRQRLAFASAALIVPASRWSRAEKEIAYRDVRAVSEWSINGQRFLDIVYTGGKHTINASMLPSKRRSRSSAGCSSPKSGSRKLNNSGPKPALDRTISHRLLADRIAGRGRRAMCSVTE